MVCFAMMTDVPQAIFQCGHCASPIGTAERRLRTPGQFDLTIAVSFVCPAMPPGEYYVRASGTVDGNPILAYYPGVSNVESGALVHVRGGDEIVADMPILPAKLFRISGTVVNAIPELAAEPQGFVLMPRDRKLDDGTATILPNLAIGKGSGYFEIRALPGVYNLIPAARATGAGNIYYYTARVPVEVRIEMFKASPWRSPAEPN